jgi:hypothetical protein
MRQGGMAEEYKRVLIITSTVYVNSSLTLLVDPEVRVKQYVESILFYLNSASIESIVVCDNSGFDYADVESIRTLALAKGKDIECLFFKGDSETIFKLGKGFGEGEIMNFIFKHSKLLPLCNAFYKVTGRIKVKNIDLMIDYVQPNVNYFQKIRINPFLKVALLDTRFYYCSKEVFQNFLVDSHFNVNDPDGFYLEHAYTEELRRNKVRFKNFLILPRYEGISGSHGGSLTQGMISYRMKFLLNLFIARYQNLVS